jgi:hypothetical protein
MGLGLAVLVALVVLLPGIAFVLGATRLHSPSGPSTPFDQHFSVGLITALLASIVFHTLALSVCLFFAKLGLTTSTDPAQVLPLLAGDVQSPLAGQSIESVRNNAIEIGLYFSLVTVFAWLGGKVFNRALPKRRTASWYDLLKPSADNPDFVVITVDLKLDSECYLFSGVVREFSVGRTGMLERVVLVYATRRTLHTRATPSAGMNVLEGGWIEIPGEYLVLQMQDARTINVDYFYMDSEEAESTGIVADFPQVSSDEK